MIYLQQNNHARKNRTRIIVGVSVSLAVIIILVQFFFPHLAGAVITSVIRPFWRTEFSIGSGSLWSPQALLVENENLKLKLEEASVRLQTIQAIEIENAELKAFFGRNVNATSTSDKILDPSKLNKRVLAPVLVRPGVGVYDELIIDGGKDLGFNVGNKVYASGDVLVGSISDVLSKTSKVSLLSSPGNILNVLIGPSNNSAMAIGRGGGQYSAELPRNIKVSAGDFVIVPSINDKPFGIVSAIESDPTQSFETVLFAPPINIYQLRWVLVEPI